MEKIIGRVKNYVFHNEDNSYSIVRIITEDGKLITAVGYFPKVGEDVLYEFEGNWVTHQTYGTQFKIEKFKKSEKQSLSGLVSYLSSSYFSGIGPKTAEKIVNLLGENAIEAIIENPNVLMPLNLGAIRIAKLKQQLVENQMNEHILVTLYGYQISGKLAMKLLNKYQMLTLEKIEENPYQLIDDIEGIGFLKADEIATKIGIERTDIRRIKAAIIYTLDHIAYQNGHMYLFGDELFEYTRDVLKIEVDLQPGVDALVMENKLIIEDDKYYLQVSYYTEINLAKKITDILNEKSSEYDENYIDTLIDMIEIQKNMHYTNVQKIAIKSAITHKITVITGGPGTGKTTIIDGLLEVYRNYHKLDFNAPDIYQKIALLAPTGRAAKRMKELLDMHTSTIHRHLGYNYDGLFVYDEGHLLPQDLIIVDEASMIDIFLANQLFKAIKNNAQVVIVGDVDQLPSVGPGQVLADLINSKLIETVRLDEIHRQAKDSNIIELASKVNHQNLMPTDLISGNDVYLINTNTSEIQNILIKQIRGALHQGYDMIEDIQVLAPIYKGDLGIDRLNEILQQTFNPNRDLNIKYGDKTYYVGDKVIQLVNDPQRLIMNGDIGVVENISYNNQNEVYMQVKFEDNIVMYEKADLDELNLAYAISIHKAQGSEYKIVIMPMIKQFMHMLKKELIYTAITRAKQYLIILGDMPLLVYAANHLSNQRQTTLALRLEEMSTLDFEDTEDDLSPYDFM